VIYNAAKRDKDFRFKIVNGMVTLTTDGERAAKAAIDIGRVLLESAKSKRK